MAMMTKVIGPISAYAIAVSKGYTGTEEEFAQEIADASTNAATAQAAADHCDDVLESIPQDYSVLSDDVDDLKSAINTIYIQDATKYITNWVQGYIRSNGTIGTATKNCATGWITFQTGKVYCTVKSGYKIRVASYTDTAGTHGTFSAFVVDPAVTGTFDFAADGTKYYKMDVQTTDEATLAPSDLPSDLIGYYQEHPTDKTLTLENKAADAKTTGDMFNKVYSGRNVLNQTTLTLDKYINNTTGSMGSSESYAVTDYIEVKTGDIIIATYGSSSVMSLRYVAAYDSTKTLLSSSGADTVNEYTVPSGVSFVRISANKTRITSELAMIVCDHTSGAHENYEPYYKGKLMDFCKTNRTEISNILRFPMTTLPSYIIDNLAYKPMGQLSKGYICLVSDDGDPGLATYTVPMLISKNVPATFAVMKASGCWNDDINKATVLDAVENHGCCLAQHGGSTWDQYDEYNLNKFFDDEQVFWDSLDVEVYGAVCPAHNINNLIRCVAGGRFGCLRTGYDDAKPRYANYTNGARSNLYGLCSQSALDGTVSTQSAVLDYCMTNNLLRIIHWHENEMDADAKARLEAIIDYAKSINMTFITMKELPWIT